VQSHNKPQNLKSNMSSDEFHLTVQILGINCHGRYGALAKKWLFWFFVGLCVGQNQMCHLWVAIKTLIFLSVDKK
jgi:hypothetical protein